MFARAIIRLLGGALVFAFAWDTQSQVYPAKPVRIIVPWPAGGPPDVLGRAHRARQAAARQAHVRLGGQRQYTASRRRALQSVDGNRYHARSIREPDMHEKIRALGVDPVGMPQEEFQRYLVAEIDKYAKLAKRIKLQLN